MSKSEFSLQHDFGAVSEADWLALAQKAVGDRPVLKALSRDVANGVKMDALGQAGDEAPQMVPNARVGAWDICTPHWQADAEALASDILSDLEGGATSVSLRIKAGLFPGVEVGELDKALAPVLMDIAGVRLLPGEEFETAGEKLLAILESKGVKAAPGVIGADPVGTLAQNGRLLTSLNEAMSRAAKLAKTVTESQPNIATFTADTTPYVLAGADAVQELAIMLAVGVAYLRAMEAEGLTLTEAAAQIELKLNTDADVVVNISKFRAARRLWAGLLNAAGAEGANSRVTATATIRAMTVKDPWVNILRATSCGFSAGVGGADTVTLMPHDTLYGVPTELARRIARNVQIILQEESGLAAVQDPAAGSYQIEQLTDELVKAAWSEFQRIEGLGGMQSYLTSGQLANDVAASWISRTAKIAKRKIGITGVSEFPDLFEKPLETSGIQYGQQSPEKPAGETLDRLPVHRDAELFEALRYQSDEKLKTTGARPAVKAVTLGTEAGFAARLAFVQNLLASIGVDVDAQAHDKSAKSDADKSFLFIILVGPDKLYLENGPEVARDLVNANKGAVWLAGKPDNWDAFADAGVTDAVTAGCDVIALAERIFAGQGEA